MAEEFPGHAGLDPQARPTDQFAPAMVQRKLGGQGALQLAGALSDFSKDARQAYQQLMPVYEQQQENKAAQYNEQHQFQNMRDLQGAVSRGEIPDYANPWLRVKLNNMVAVTEARNAGAQAYNDLQKDPAFHGDDVNAVNKFLSDRLEPTMQGKDSWQSAAMAPVLAQQHQQVLQEWNYRRGQERLNEAHTATGATVLQSISDRLGDTPIASPDSAQKLPGMIADIQQQYTHLTNVVDKATASKWISDAAFQAGRIHRDADLTRSILDNVKGQDGLKLSDLAENKANLQILPREIQELKNSDDEAYVRGRELSGARERMALMDEVQKTLKPGQTYLDAEITPQQWQKLSPEGYADMQRTLAAVSQEMLTNKNVKDQFSSDPIMRQLLAGSIDGTLKVPDRIKLMGALTMLGETGQTKLETFARFLNFQKDISYGDTKPETIYNLNRWAESGTLTMDRVLSSLQDGSLDRRTGSEWMGIAARMEAVGARYNNTVNEMVKDLGQQVAAPFQEKGLLGGIGNTDSADTMHANQDKATAAFRSEFYNRLSKSPDWDKLPFNEQWKQMQELKDNIAKTYGGEDTATWLKARPAARSDEFQKSPTAPAPSPSVEKPTGQEQAQAVQTEPLDDDLDKGTLDGARKALEVKSDADLRTVAEAWAPYLKTPPAPAVDVPRGSTFLRPTEHTFASFTDLRQIRSARFQAGDKGIVSISKGTVHGTGIQKDVDERETQLWQSEMAHLIASKPDAMQASQTIQQITAGYNQSGKITPQQQAQLRSAIITRIGFQELRDQVGYTPDEVKAKGPTAWRQMPMFANPNDLSQRGEQVMKQLGVKEFQTDTFYEAQLRMLKLMREGQAQE